MYAWHGMVSIGIKIGGMASPAVTKVMGHDMLMIIIIIIDDDMFTRFSRASRMHMYVLRYQRTSVATDRLLYMNGLNDLVSM